MHNKKNKIKITNSYHEFYSKVFEIIEEHRSYYLAKLNKSDGTIVVYKNECKKLTDKSKKEKGRNNE